jgi:hypothetical protein
MRHLRLLSILAALLLAASCARTQAPATDDDAEPPTEPPTEEPDPRPIPPATAVDGVPRLVAIGDVHGDVGATRTALKIAGAIDDEDRWIGGELVVVQTGDQIDRGDDDRAILDLFEEIADQAHAAGGAVYSLSGNHEVMNVELDFRYVTAAGFEAFADVEVAPEDIDVAALPDEQQGRGSAFRPGGPYALLLAGRNLTMTVGEIAFVHGAILPQHVEYGLERINTESQAWMRGETEMPFFLDSSESVTWARDYSDDPDEADCEMLDEVLAAMDAEVMVVGHTRHEEIVSACDGKVWLIDVGMAAYYEGSPAVLEITNGTAFEVLTTSD